MLLRKRPRPQMKRTTSVSGMKVDLNDLEDQEPSGDHNPRSRETGGENPPVIGLYLDTDLMNYTSSFVSPRGRRTHSGLDTGTDDSVPFLRTCSFCYRRLSPGRDIYMYKGDTAFCSTECREQQMKQDERKENCTTGSSSSSSGSSKKDSTHTSQSPSAATSRGSGKGQTVIAA